MEIFETGAVSMRLKQIICQIYKFERCYVIMLLHCNLSIVRKTFEREKVEFTREHCRDNIVFDFKVGLNQEESIIST